jgi:hypothetical protein
MVKKEQERKERNRAFAQASRDRKKLESIVLQEKISQLVEENQILHQRLAALETANSVLFSLVSTTMNASTQACFVGNICMPQNSPQAQGNATDWKNK